MDAHPSTGPVKLATANVTREAFDLHTAAYAKVTEGVNLAVPSGKTVYLAPGAFVMCGFNFVTVTNAGVRGPGMSFVQKAATSESTEEPSM